MNSLEPRHPENDLLLAYLDGELRGRPERQVRRHVAACWQCRAELDQLQRMVTECVRYRQNLASAVPAPPQPWKDLTREFDRLAENPEGARQRRLGWWRWVLVGAGAVSLAAATVALRSGFHIFPQTPAPPVQDRPLALPRSSPASTSARTDGSSSEVRKPSVPAGVPAPVTELASLGDELRAVAALHQVGADLGDPVEVAREGSYVVIGGAGVPPARQREIREAVSAQPKVVVRFAEATSPLALPTASNGNGPTAGMERVPPNPNRLESQLGGRAQSEAFTAELLSREDAAMARAYALRRLAREFPAGNEGLMKPEERRLLEELARQHLEALAGETASIDGFTSPVLIALGAARPNPETATAAGSWQEAAERVLIAARQMEQTAAALVGAAAADGKAGTSASAQNLPQQLLSALAGLRANVQQCEGLLSR